MVCSLQSTECPDLTQVPRFSSKPLFFLSHLDGPISGSFKVILQINIILRKQQKKEERKRERKKEGKKKGKEEKKKKMVQKILE